MKKAAILYDEYIPLVDAIKAKIQDADCFSALDFNPDDYDLIISAGYKGEVNFNVLKSHLSLLPSFDSSEPVADALREGVKVTGVTVYYTQPRRIVAQYPIFIYNDAHYEELKCELEYVEQAFFPSVIEKIIKNEMFESRTIMNSTCGGCKGCSK